MPDVNIRSLQGCSVPVPSWKGEHLKRFTSYIKDGFTGQIDHRQIRLCLQAAVKMTAPLEKMPAFPYPV